MNSHESASIAINSSQFPNEWQVVSLRDAIEELKNGFASGKRDKNGIVQIRMNNVTTDGRLIFESYLKVPIPENISNWLLKKGDFLFNNTNSIDLVGKSTIFYDAPFQCTFSNHFTRIRFKKDLVLPELILYHFLILWEKGHFKSVAIRHVGQSAVHTDYLLKLQIPLPPLPEQRRIAEVLGTMDSAIQKVGGAIESTERLKKGLMQRLLTRGIGHERFKESEVGRVPEEWEVVKLGDISRIKYGLGQPPQTKIDGAPMIRATNINSGKIFEKDVLMIDITKISTTREVFLKEGDIIVVRSGAYTGDVGLVTKKWEGSVAGYDLIVSSNRDKVDPRFLSNYLLSPQIQKICFIGLKTRSAQPHLNSNQLENISVALPPLPEQRRIAEILSAVDRKLELEHRRKEKLSKVKKGLMSELLTGRKRVKAE